MEKHEYFILGMMFGAAIMFIGFMAILYLC